MSSQRRESLLDLPLERLRGIADGLGLPAYRAAQIFDWLHTRNASGLAEMTDLPAALRAELAQSYDVWPMKLQRKVVSADGSIKYGWLTAEGNPVEAVLMPGFDYGTAICVSSQSGCGMACGFCQTGYMGLRQYLSAGEILQQLYHAEADSGTPVDRIVFMGMGEPLLNLRAVRRTIDILCGKPGRQWSPRRITVSTVGLTAPILTMARTFPRVNLALSLHFTTAEGRRKHMPQAEDDPAKLAEALFFYRQINGGKISIEYTLMRDLNDSELDAKRLIKFARLSGVTPLGADQRPAEPAAAAPSRRGSGVGAGPAPARQGGGWQTPPQRSKESVSELVAEALSHPAPPHQQALPLHVNIIAYNLIPSASYEATPESGINAFARILRDAEVPVTVRHSRGRDVAAACGMLGTEMVATRTAVKS